MTLEQLRVFVAVAEHEHVTRAARVLNLTQSATSAAVGALEERYQVRLFDRLGRGISLTAVGKTFLVEARAVLARAAAAETMLVDLAALKVGSLAIAASQTVAGYWLPQRLADYRSRHSGIQVNVTIGNTEAVAALTRNGMVDLGLVEGVVNDPQLTTVPVADDSLVLVVGKSYPLAGAGDIDRVLDGPWVIRERGSGTRAVLETALVQAGRDPAKLNVALELPSNESVRSAVEAGAGAAVLSSLVIQDAVEAGALVAVDWPLPTRKFFLLSHKHRHTTRAAAAFSSLVGQIEPSN